MNNRRRNFRSRPQKNNFRSNGDPVLAQNYLQHADHYLRRYNELSDKRLEKSENKPEELNPEK